MSWNPIWEKLRDPVSGLMHLWVALIALVAVVVVLISAGGSNWLKQVSLLIYGVSLVLMFSASAAYHLVKPRPASVLFLRKLDHSAIYLLIAGTYTPICLHFFTGFWQWGILAIIWVMAGIGIVVKLFIINAPRWITAGVYLLMGWLSLLAIPEMLQVLPVGVMAWLLAGGFFFTVGAVVYITKRPQLWPGVFGFHELWHVFVVLGCFSHFIVMAAFIAPT